jgi:cytochrome c oxidase subunit II
VDTRREFDSLLGLYLPIALVVVAVVFGAILFAALRYRGGEEGATSRRAGAPALEIAYAVLLAAVVALLLTRTFSTEAKVDETGRPAAVQVRITGFQWGWRFDYLGRGVTVTGNSQRPPVFAVPLGRRVAFTISSRDVIHSFWVPDERFKRDAFPGRATRFELTFDQPGLLDGRCAEFCGLRHDAMTFDVLALPPRRFGSWLQTRRAGGGR